MQDNDDEIARRMVKIAHIAGVPFNRDDFSTIVRSAECCGECTEERMEKLWRLYLVRSADEEVV
jgi:hypothetical protein